MEGIKIRLPRIEEIEQIDSSEDEPIVDALCDQTDLVTITNGAVFKDCLDDIFQFSAPYYTESKYHPSNKVWGYDNEHGSSEVYELTDETVGIRPVLELSDELFDHITQNAHIRNDGKPYIEFGLYPQRANGEVKKYCDKELRGRYAVVHHTGKVICINDAKLGKKPKWVPHPVYEFHDKKWIGVKAHFIKEHRRDSVCLIDRTEYSYGDYVWVELLPIDWYVDYEHKLLISKRVLLAGIRFSNDKEYTDKSKVENLNIYRFLNRCMLPDILQFTYLHDLKKEEKVTEEKSEIVTILEEIDKYRRYYTGNDDITLEVQSLIDNHNKKIKELELSTNSMDLQVEYKSIDILNNEFVNSLNSLLERLKEDSVKTKTYYDMIDILNCESKCELSKFITNIKKFVSESKLIENERDSFLKELDKIINSNIDRVTHYIDECCNGNNPNKTIIELQNEFRKDLHPLLEKIHNASVNRDLVREIMEYTEAIINNQYIETKNLRSKYILDLIKEVADSIKANGNEKDLERLKNELNFEIDYSQSIIDVLKRLNDIFKKIYQIELDITDRSKTQEVLDKSRVDVDLKDIFKKSNNPIRSLSNKGVN